MNYCLIRERKSPPDFRCALNPEQALAFAQSNSNISIWAEPSAHRCFSDALFQEQGIEINESRTAQVYLGIKEVPPADLLPNSTYFFFSHTIKRQPYNLKLLQEILNRNIRLIDYECLRDSQGQRLIGFGFYAGVVGAYNTLRTFSIKSQTEHLPHTSQLNSRAEMDKVLAAWQFPNIRILLTGQGRVAQGALSVLKQLNFKEIDANLPFPETGRWYKNIDYNQYNVRIKDGGFDADEFFSQPQLYKAHFLPFISNAQILMTGHFWSSISPRFLSAEELGMTQVQVVGDISCDINGPLPCTLRASTLMEPAYGWDKHSFEETDLLSPSAIAVMAVDNLPAALPADASTHFGSELLPLLQEFENQPDALVFEQATIAQNGKLMPKYAYLQRWVDGLE
jgi:saccharopine dehydrogenase (NAD+, L-lysine forming)